MVFGIGKVHAAMMLGFLVGLIVAHSQSPTGNHLIQYIGLALLVIGLFAMFNKRTVSGVGGGLLTGFGLGATLGGYLWPPSTAVHP